MQSSYTPKYQIKQRIPRSFYKSAYPQKINTLGDLLRRTRMDLDLEVKQLAKQLGVCEQAVINLEMNRSKSRPHILKSVVSFLKPHLNGSIPEDDFWTLCFKNDKFYPKEQNTLGEKLRATRMQNFLSIKQLAKQLKVDPSSIHNWENEKHRPLEKSIQKLSKICGFEI